MYSSNHPKLEALKHLSCLIAERIGVKNPFLNDFADIVDGLAADVWPVYPEIAAEHGLPGGSYTWRIRDKSVVGLKDYLEAVFDDYRLQGIRPDDLQCSYFHTPPSGGHDEVLRRFAGLERRAE